jgi:hypothetical protein
VPGALGFHRRYFFFFAAFLSGAFFEPFFAGAFFAAFFAAISSSFSHDHLRGPCS